MTRITCSAASAACGESLPGKAPKARYWVLLERPRPWPARAEDAAPPHLVRQVSELGGARLGLIRRRGSRGGGGALVVADTLTGQAATGSLGADGADLAALVRRLEPAEPMLLVCTHTARDRCCGSLGSPVAAALAARYPNLTWETSHVGGHRLAANLVCLPHGYVFSRLTPATALEAAERYLRGRLLLEACRGRAGLDPAAQAAELMVRRGAGFDRADGVVTESRGGGRFEVRLPGRRPELVAVTEVTITEDALTSCSGERGPLVGYEPAPGHV